MKRLLAAAAATLGLALAFAAAAAPPVTTESGQLRGVDTGKVVKYKGIPYAAPPVGALRWAPPAPPAAWRGVRDASTYGAICPQPTRPHVKLAAGSSGKQSEDCLFLNVWAPKGASRAPVMVWIHGGAFRFGSGESPFYSGWTFARDGVVLVTINYRLGALGWFAHPALTRAAAPGAPLGDYGLMDQIAALKWVARNIAAFGGDPENVTVFGESAGGASVLALLATPSAAGLFQKAIVESGGGWGTNRTLAAAEQEGVRISGLPAGATVDQLRALPLDKLSALPMTLSAVGPITDGRLMPLPVTQAFDEGRFAHVPMIIGSNSDEASLMKAFKIPSQAVLARTPPTIRAQYTKNDNAAAADIFTDSIMGAPAEWIAARASVWAPTWLYYFDYAPTISRDQTAGAIHGGEIPFVFGNWRTIAGVAATAEDDALAAAAHACWVDFATSGRPACDGDAWAPFSPATDAPMEFGEVSGLRPGFREARYNALDKALLPIFLGRR